MEETKTSKERETLELSLNNIKIIVAGTKMVAKEHAELGANINFVQALAYEGLISRENNQEKKDKKQNK